MCPFVYYNFGNECTENFCVQFLQVGVFSNDCKKFFHIGCLCFQFFNTILQLWNGFLYFSLLLVVNIREYTPTLVNQLSRKAELFGISFCEKTDGKFLGKLKAALPDL